MAPAFGLSTFLVLKFLISIPPPSLLGHQILPRCSAHCSKHPGTMWVALPLCLLSALLATGCALQCEVCASREQSCSGPLQPCAPSEGTCITVMAEIRLEGNSFSYTGKSCLEPKNCEPGPFSLTYPHNVTVRANIACCDTDGCNAGAIPVPTVSSVPNGRQCLSFFKSGADHWQKKKELLACTGAEDHCVEDYGVLTLGDIKLRMTAAGCGSPGACVKRALVKKYAQGVPEILSQAKCYPVPRAGGGIGEP
ncbi:phospholipase A2 inhibitor and Ly6/PLAUR domain-containing protein-like [Lepidochelys kempii]|uniref:phospholipase A2 inhibitor and Ly6/PLAUR domain-containing protein-like n=1 Tax=Lepidochelys kempii TaxID=8472 RepID=UPI003C6EB2C9